MTHSSGSKPVLDRILCKKQLKAYVPYTPQHIARLEDAGKFPKRLQLGPNRVGWLESEIIEWIETLKAQRNGGSEAGNGFGTA
jgi:prophage regulatory protein